jgi:sugar lactone lactonase YvrE
MPSNKNMKTRLMPLVENLLLKKLTLIEIISNSLKVLTQRHRIKVKFLLNVIVGMSATALIALNMAPSALPAISYKTSWIGNTFGGGSKWVQNFVDGMYVAADGTVYTNSVWDEAGREAGIYKNGDVIGMAGALHGWARSGGAAVTANSKYLYIAMKQASAVNPGQDFPPAGTTWYAVRRYNLAGVPAPFAGGRGYDKSMLIVSTSGHVTGLASAGSELYVSDSGSNRIRVFNSDTMAELRSWSFARPGRITVDAKGDLWIIQPQEASNPAKILRYSKTGTLLPQQITDVVMPTALAYSQGKLLVAENGPRQQVLMYNIDQAPKLVGTVGTQGGIYAGRRGEIGATKLYGLTGVGADAAGNIYVSCNGFKGAARDFSGTDLRKFSSSGALQWRLLGLEFVDNADADPGTDGVDVFTKHEHFVMDYSKASGQQWTYKAYTADKFRYPDDARFQNIGHTAASASVRRINGKRFLYLEGMHAPRLYVYRFDGEIAVPSAIFAQPNTGDWPANPPASVRWLWRDKNGDGKIQSNEYESLGASDGRVWAWQVDSKGDVWLGAETGKIQRYRVQGVDTYGSPIYTSTARDVIPMPAPFVNLERLKYFPQTDVMYVGGYTSARPKSGSEWGKVGTEIVRYDNWSTTRKMRWRVVLPYNPTANPVKLIQSMDVAGDRLFAVDFITAVVSVYDTATGALLTQLTPGPEVSSESGWVDIPHGIRAYRRANGEYLVFVEEDFKAKVIMYRMTG